MDTIGRMQLPDGRIVDAVEVPITDDENSQSLVFILGDGTKLTATVTIPLVVRAKREYDHLGQPVYQMRDVRLDIRVSDIPDGLMGKPSQPQDREKAAGGVSEVR